MLDPSLDRSIEATRGNGYSLPDPSRERNLHQISPRAQHAPIPESFICPLTKALMKNPVIDREGNSYEKDAILRYLQLVDLSPVTENPLQESDLVENRGLKMAIQAASEGELERSKNRPKARRFRIINSLPLSMRGAMNKVSPMPDSFMTSSSVEGDSKDAPPERQRRQLDPESPCMEAKQKRQRARAQSEFRRNRQTARRENVRQTWHSSMMTGGEALDIKTAAFVQAGATDASLKSALHTALDRSSVPPQQTKAKVGALAAMPEEAAGKATLPHAKISVQGKYKSAEERFEARMRKKLTEDPSARAKYERRNKVAKETASGAKKVSKSKQIEAAENDQAAESKCEKISEKQLSAASTVQHALRIESPVSRNNQEDSLSGASMPQGDSHGGRSKFEIAPSNEPDNLQLQFQRARRGKDRRTMLSEKLESRQKSTSVPIKNQEVASSGQTKPERKNTRGGSSDIENDRSNPSHNSQIKCQKARRIKERRKMLDEKLKSRMQSASVDIKPTTENKESSRRRNETGRRSRERRRMRAALNEKIESMPHNNQSTAQTKASAASTRDPTVGGSVQSMDRNPKVGVVRPWELASFEKFSDLTLTSFEEEARGMPDLDHSWNSDARREAETPLPGEGSSPPAPWPSASPNSMPVMGEALRRTSSTGAMPEHSDSVPPWHRAADRRGSAVSWTDLAEDIKRAQHLSMQTTDTGAIWTQHELEAMDRSGAGVDQPHGGGAGHVIPRRRPRRRQAEDIEALSLDAMYGDEADVMLSLGIFEGSDKTRSDILNALREASGDVHRALGNLLGFEPSMRNFLL